MKKKARIVIGANYGDEGKGTIVARYTKSGENVLNVLTNGGAQRGHSILTEQGVTITSRHFGSGTHFGADNYYSAFFILNPMQFEVEYKSLVVKPNKIYRDFLCRWSTPYDSMANVIKESQLGRHASCGMGIWNTIKRWTDSRTAIPFDDFIGLDDDIKSVYLTKVRSYYEKDLVIPRQWKDVWESPGMISAFIETCKFMHSMTIPVNGIRSLDYTDLIFENGQGLLLSDNGWDAYDRTPSDTGAKYALSIAMESGADEISLHYVTRPYLTRHGDGHLEGESDRSVISRLVTEDRTNHYNGSQGKFRYGMMDIRSLKERITEDSRGMNDVVLEVTHCDEMDRVAEFKKDFKQVNAYDTAIV